MPTANKKPSWMKQHRCRPNLPNKDHTDRFLQQLKDQLAMAKALSHETKEDKKQGFAEIISESDSADLSSLGKDLHKVRYDLEQATEDLQDIHYDRGLFKVTLEALEVQKRELTLHKESIHQLLACTEPDSDLSTLAMITAESVAVTRAEAAFTKVAADVPALERSFSSHSHISGASQGLSCARSEDELLAEASIDNQAPCFNCTTTTTITSSSCYVPYDTAASLSTDSAEVADLSLHNAAEDQQPTTNWIPTYCTEQEEAEASYRAVAATAGGDEAEDDHDFDYSAFESYSAARVAQQQFWDVEEQEGEEYHHAQYRPTTYQLSYDDVEPSCPSQWEQERQQVEKEEKPSSPLNLLVAADQVLSSLQLRQQHALATLPDVEMQISVIQMNILDLRAGLRRCKTQIKCLNMMKDQLQIEAKQLRKQQGAIWYPYAARAEKLQKRELGKADYLESRISKVQGTYDREFSVWMDWVKEAQAAYRRRNNLPEDYAMGYPGMPPVFEGRGSLAAALGALDQERELYGCTWHEISTGLELVV